MSDAWKEVTEAEAETLRPYMVDAREMSAEDAAAMREAFAATMQSALRATAEELGRAPTEEETDILARAVVCHLNETLAPELRQRAVGLH